MKFGDYLRVLGDSEECGLECVTQLVIGLLKGHIGCQNMRLKIGLTKKVMSHGSCERKLRLIS